MTVSTSLNKIIYQGNGSNTTFSFPFPGVAVSDILVFYTDASGNVTQINSAFYSVALNAPVSPNPTGVGGIVTYPLTGSPIALGTRLTIERTLSEVQTLSLANQGPVPTDIEMALDYATMLIQQIQNQLSQSIQVQPSDPIPTPLPSAAQRASMLFGFDSSGNPIATTGGGASVNVSTAMTPVVQAASIAAAQALLAIPTLPAGVEVPFAGLVPPAGWYMEYGQTVSRTGDAALFQAICPTYTGLTITNGSATVSGFATTANFKAGYGFETPGLTGPTTIATIVNNTTITLNNTATANATTARILPFGVGDGLTTFQLPDSRGYVYAGIDNPLGNGTAGIITAAGGGFDGTKINSGGTQNITLTVAQLPAHAHPGSSVAITDTGHVHGTTPASPIVEVSGGGSLTFTAGSNSSAGLSINSAMTGIQATPTIASQGGGTFHGNLQPTQTRFMIIYRGVDPTLT